MPGKLAIDRTSPIGYAQPAAARVGAFLRAVAKTCKPSVGLKAEWRTFAAGRGSLSGTGQERTPVLLARPIALPAAWLAVARNAINPSSFYPIALHACS